MPCRCDDYPTPDVRNKQLQRAAKLYAYVCTKLNRAVPTYALRASQNEFCTDEQAFVMLCNTISKFDEKQLDAIVYNARDPVARDLASWWEEHQQADAARRAEEAAQRTQMSLVRSGVNKLTDEELEAILDVVGVSIQSSSMTGPRQWVLSKTDLSETIEEE